MKYVLIITILFGLLQQAVLLIPPKFQWKVIDFEWDDECKNNALATKAYIPENNMPTGLARWRDKLFITVPRWKTGVPSSLNYIYLNGTQSSPLRPYPTWKDAYVRDSARHINTNATVVSAFRVHVDKCDRLWVVDNGVVDMANEAKQITDPAILVFDLNTDKLLVRKDLMGDVLEDSSVLTSIVVDLVGKGCDDAYAYITDMGSSSIIVFSLKTGDTWRVQNHYFLSDPQATTYKVGGVEFCWCDGVSSAAISGAKCDGSRDLYVHPTSSTRQYKLSTKLLRDKNVSKEEIFSGVQMVGDKGPLSQTAACDYDQKNNVLFFTQICKNAIGCWDTDKPLSPDSLVTLVKDCNLLEFPNDIKVDNEGNLWILSNRQARFLNNSMDFSQVNFRVLTAPVPNLVQGTACQRQGRLSRAFSALGSKRNSLPTSSKGLS